MFEEECEFDSPHFDYTSLPPGDVPAELMQVYNGVINGEEDQDNVDLGGLYAKMKPKHKDDIAKVLHAKPRYRAIVRKVNRSKTLSLGCQIVAMLRESGGDSTARFLRNPTNDQATSALRMLFGNRTKEEIVYLAEFAKDDPRIIFLAGLGRTILDARSFDQSMI